MTEFLARNAQVKEEWIDYNGHMNVAYYVLVFDHSTDALLEKLNLGTDYRTTENSSFFVVESHVTYDSEVKKGDLLVVKSKLLGYDTKRLHIFHEMFEKNGGAKCATNEVMVLHVDMETRRTTEISSRYNNVLEKANTVSLEEGFPANCGRAVKKLKSKK